MIATAERALSSRRRRGSVASETRRRDERPVSAASPRLRIQAALGRCHERTRLVIALLLLERMSPAEAADALGIPTRELDRRYSSTLARLRRVVRDRTSSQIPARRAS